MEVTDNPVKQCLSGVAKNGAEMEARCLENPLRSSVKKGSKEIGGSLKGTLDRGLV